jgi:hypothetical protein
MHVSQDPVGCIIPPQFEQALPRETIGTAWLGAFGDARADMIARAPALALNATFSSIVPSGMWVGSGVVVSQPWSGTQTARTT